LSLIIPKVVIIIIKTPKDENDSIIECLFDRQVMKLFAYNYFSIELLEFR
jgi:hypothetical protein